MSTIKMTVHAECWEQGVSFVLSEDDFNRIVLDLVSADTRAAPTIGGKCGLCGNLLKDCHPACTETWNGESEYAYIDSLRKESGQ